MKRIFAFLLGSMCLFAHTIFAHPMGNFSVNHYSRLRVTPRGVELHYVLDLAEIPTLALLQAWNIDRAAPQGEIDRHASVQAREWLNGLVVSVNGRPARLKLESSKVAIADGAGNLPILRMDIAADVDDRVGGTIEFEDRNYPERAGWKEIVVDGGAGVSLVQASQSGKDLSNALTRYPPDPTLAPPQDLRAKVEWRVDQPRVYQPIVASSPTQPVEAAAKPVVAAIAQPAPVRAASSPVTQTAQAAPPGTVVRGDFVSRILHQRELSFSMILLALAASFALGAAHALTPGHGKTIVAAYLVGSRGTLKHAAFLGAMVTFTHTITVFALGLATLFLFRYVVPENITVALGAISGLSIVAIGAWMLYKRISARGHSHSHVHSHEHEHAHRHSHAHEHSHDHAHVHSHGTHEHNHTHSHDHHMHTHSHMPDELSWGGLIALGASGGLVPCESALILLLGAIALGRVGLGLLLLLSFSLGLALVLMLIGVLVLYAKNLLPERARSGGHPFFRYASIASPAVVIVVGLLMTGVSLGWVRSGWMIG